MRVIRALPYAACIIALSGVAACGSAEAPPTTPAASAKVVKSLAITISGTTITPAPSQVEIGVGEALELTVTTDREDELHSHGFNDLEAELKAGIPSTVRLVGTETGVFEVETHDPALTILTVAVR
jgi:hypothetical protein